MSTVAGLGVAFVVHATALAARGSTLDRPGVADTSVFASLHLWPASSSRRMANGAPGPQYWQNRADYTIRATRDTAADEVRGTMTLRYTNHSPVALSHIWMQVEQNAFTDSSLTAMVFPSGAMFSALGFQGGGDRVTEFDQVLKGRKVPLRIRVWDTMLYAWLAAPLAPGHAATFAIA
ncbi:MAG: hypothetical protein ACYCVE_11440 [Gemmatimonadaceae bacterium]